MRTLTISAVVALIAGCGASKITEIRGELTFNSRGIGSIQECGSGRNIQLGTMASSPYFTLHNRYDELSRLQSKSVVVEAKGSLTESDGDSRLLELQRPTVTSIASGSCDA